jgi:hypothetical protein
MQDCNNLIYRGIVIRMTATVISLYGLATTPPTLQYILLILPVLLTVLDKLDNILIPSYKKQCTKQFYYQSTDKIYDSITYVIVYFFLRHVFRLDTKSDTILLMFILYRIIGVILFYNTKDSRWLIVFFDFVKEFLLYLAIFRNNYSYIFLFILCKVAFEYYYHTIHNPNKYKDSQSKIQQNNIV